MTPAIDVPAPRLPCAALLLVAAVFALAHTQAPLYYSNQNQYFLHGLAQGGRGDLDRDWLANTADPTPVFSAAVAWTYRHVGEWPFQAVYFVMLMGYFVSLAAVLTALPSLRSGRGGTGLIVILTLLIVLHAAVVRKASVGLAGTDYPWYLQSGVAGQYVLGPGLQPSAFGVFLIASLAAFLHDRPILAAAFAVAACIFHATYLLPAAWLTLGYMHVLWHGGRRRASFALGAGILVAVLPIAWYSVRTFAPTTPEQFAEAQHILADIRIPHHAQVSRWLDNVALAQIAWIAVAVALVRGTPLFPVMAISAAAGVVLTVVQAVTEYPTLALLFPWRVSAVLMPVATTVILARMVTVAASVMPRRNGLKSAETVTIVGSAIVRCGCAIGGVAMMAFGVGYATNAAELPTLEYVRDHKKPGDVYLIPVDIPAPQTGRRGPPSTSFTPPPRPAPGATLIAVDLQQFRLFTGAPLYVDFKSIPYKDVEVLEWYRRIRQVEDWYKQPTWGPQTRDELARAGITHVLVTADRHLAGPALEQVYADETYRVYRVRPGA
jgi:Domain of unknown function (DUF6798)